MKINEIYEEINERSEDILNLLKESFNDITIDGCDDKGIEAYKNVTCLLKVFEWTSSKLIESFEKSNRENDFIHCVINEIYAMMSSNEVNFHEIADGVNYSYSELLKLYTNLKENKQES